jgi:hypothetical protein
MDPGKVKEVLEWKPPTTVSEVLSTVHSKLLQDHEANYWIVEQGKQVSLERGL